jgi:hypothetical protein
VAATSSKAFGAGNSVACSMVCRGLSAAARGLQQHRVVDACRLAKLQPVLVRLWTASNEQTVLIHGGTSTADR